MPLLSARSWQHQEHAERAIMLARLQSASETVGWRHAFKLYYFPYGQKTAYQK